MGLPYAHVWVTLASLALVLWLLVLQVDRASPGPLSATHAQVDELAQRGACRRCHASGERSMADACATCHAGVVAGIARGQGFHGTLRDADARDCAGCHGEHAGSGFRPLNARSYERAGFATRADYDHAELDFELAGRHAELECSACHANADVLFLARGQTRFLGLAQGCQNCHEDAHDGRIARACADCHGQEHPFALVASFEHDSFASECAHAAVSCAQCHPRGSAHDSELLAGADPPARARSCQDCHASPHSVPFVAAASILAGVAEGESCSLCHSEAHGSFRGHPAATPPALHAASGFALDAPHAALACRACHLGPVDEEPGFVAHVPARSADDCGACHGDPHGGEFDAGAFAGEGCRACHGRADFTPSTFGPDQHGRGDFALVASHAAVACVRCHPTTAREERRFEGTPTACADCHADAHRGAFDARADAQGCARCHEPTLFSEYRPAAFEHAETGFALDGAHARAACESCHPRSAEPDESGRAFGFALAPSAEPAGECAACHADVHGGLFDRPGLPRTVDGRGDCARCHGSESFTTPASGTFEHERWTGYPLAGFHEGVECAQCHPPAIAADEHGRAFGRAPTRCHDCHADPHVGQFVVAGVSDCARCHLDTGALAFDHQRDSRYALDPVHAALACGACHVPWPLPGGGEAVRYKPLGTACADCHAAGFLERARGSAPRGGAR